ncbi:hypothetical protein AgCh_036123 [Apium graveolens]
MSQSSSSANKNGCSSALHRACLELQGSASKIVRLIDQEKNGSEAAGREHTEYQDSIINALTVENFKLKEENGAAKSLLISEIVDDNDVELKKLKKEMGFLVFMAVKIGLEEINKHNPSGRYPVAKLWHVKENREARLDEIMQSMLKKTTRKRKAGEDPTGECQAFTK